MEIKLAAFIAEAICTNTELYPVINKIYKANEYDCLKVLKNTATADELAFNCYGSVEQDDMYRKAISILLNENIECDELINKLYKVYNYTYTYIKNHKVLRFKEYLRSYAKKLRNKGYGSYDAVKLTDSNCIMFLFFAQMEDKNIIGDEEIEIYLQNLVNRLQQTNDNSRRIGYDKIKDTDMPVLEDKYEELSKEYQLQHPFILVATEEECENPDKASSIAQDAISYEFLYDLYKIDLDKIIPRKLTKKEIIETMFYYYYTHKKDFNDNDKLIKWLYPALQIRYLLAGYKEAKEYTKNITNEETILKNKELSKNNISLINDNEKLTEENIKRQKENLKLQKENKKLLDELEKYKNYKSEIIPLRNYIFSNQEPIAEDEESLEEYENNLKILSSYDNIIIIGGKNNWINKMKELLPNFQFISAGTLNYDAALLENKIVIINTACISHGMYYKVISNINRMKGYYLCEFKKNTELSIQKLAELITR